MSKLRITQLFLELFIENSISNHGVTTKPDVLVALTHFYLVALGSLRCSGIVDENLDPEGNQYRNLPPGWKSVDGTYKGMKYESKEVRVHTLNVSVDERKRQLELKIEQEQTTRSIIFDYEQIVAAMQGPLKTMLPRYGEIFRLLERDLYDPAVNNNGSNGFPFPQWLQIKMCGLKQILGKIFKRCKSLQHSDVHK